MSCKELSSHLIAYSGQKILGGDRYRHVSLSLNPLVKYFTLPPSLPPPPPPSSLPPSSPLSSQIAGIVLTARYRNLKDPQANPSAFL